MWEKLIENPNGVQRSPCVWSQHGVLGGVGKSSGWQGCSSGQAGSEIFWQQFETGKPKWQAALWLYYVGEKVNVTYDSLLNKIPGADENTFEKCLQCCAFLGKN